MKSWRDLKLGDKVIYHFEEFDGSYKAEGVVIEVYKDHAIVSIPDITVWYDDDSEDMFDIVEG